MNVSLGSLRISLFVVPLFTSRCQLSISNSLFRSFFHYSFFNQANLKVHSSKFDKFLNSVYFNSGIGYDDIQTSQRFDFSYKSSSVDFSNCIFRDVTVLNGVPGGAIHSISYVRENLIKLSECMFYRCFCQYSGSVAYLVGVEFDAQYLCISNCQSGFKAHVIDSKIVGSYITHCYLNYTTVIQCGYDNPEVATYLITIEGNRHCYVYDNFSYNNVAGGCFGIYIDTTIYGKTSYNIISNSGNGSAVESHGAFFNYLYETKIHNVTGWNDWPIIFSTNSVLDLDSGSFSQFHGRPFSLKSDYSYPFESVDCYMCRFDFPYNDSMNILNSYNYFADPSITIIGYDYILNTRLCLSDNKSPYDMTDFIIIICLSLLVFLIFALGIRGCIMNRKKIESSKEFNDENGNDNEMERERLERERIEQEAIDNEAAQFALSIDTEIDTLRSQRLETDKYLDNLNNRFIKQDES